MQTKSYYATASVTNIEDTPTGNDVLILKGSSGSTIVKSIKVSTVDATVATIKYKTQSGNEQFSFKLNLDDNGYVLIDSFDVINSGDQLFLNADQNTCKIKVDVVEQ